MSIVAIEWAFRAPVEVPSAKLVLLALADHADNSGYCWPSTARLCDRTNLSRATIFRALDLLAGLGLVQLIQRTGRSNGYHLAIDPSQYETAPVSECDPPRLNTRPPPSQYETHNRKEPSKNPQGSAKRARQLPENWQPDDTLLAWAKERAPHVDTTEETDKFKDYYRSKGEPRKDWAASWRNWIRRSRREYGPAVAAFPTPLDRKRARNHERINAALDRRSQGNAAEPAGNVPQLRLVKSSSQIPE